MTLTGVKRTAQFSACGGYRLTLGRTWDDRPKLLACLFNPSDANLERDDPTVTLVCQIAAHHGYGGVTVVNGIPLIGSTPSEAIELTNHWDTMQEWHFRDRLHQNLGVITSEVERAGAVLLAWGALADRCGDWFENVLEEIECALPDGVPLYCLGKTKSGQPKHPLARGKHKVPKDAPLLLFRDMPR